MGRAGCVDQPLYCATSLSHVWSFSKHETTSVPIIVIYRAGRTEEIVRYRNMGFRWSKDAAPAIRNRSLNPLTRFRRNITNVFWIQFSDIIMIEVVQDVRSSIYDD